MLKYRTALNYIIMIMHQTKAAMISKVLLVSELDFTFHCNVDAAKTMHFGKVTCDQKRTPQWILTFFSPGKRENIFTPYWLSKQ
jgi:hypothetical protein